MGLELFYVLCIHRWPHFISIVQKGVLFYLADSWLRGIGRLGNLTIMLVLGSGGDSIWIQESGSRVFIEFNPLLRQEDRFTTM